MSRKLQIMAATVALTGLATPAFADGGHHHMTTFQSIVHFLSSPTHGLITLGVAALVGFVALKAIRKRS